MAVSVIIPYYEGRSTIGRAVRSLERQTVRPSEIVIVDDGSPTAPLPPSATESPIPIRVIRREENRGIAATRNEGIRAARQPWIAFLDHDDEWAPVKLERQWRVLEAEGGCQGRQLVVFGRLLMETRHAGAHLHPPRRAISAVEAGGRRAVRAFARHGNVVPLVTVLLPQELFARYGYLDETLRGGGDDTELVLRLIGEGIPFRFDGHGQGRTWSVAHRRTGRNYSDDVPRWVGDLLDLIPRLAERYADIAPLRAALVARARFQLGRHYEKQGKASEAMREYGHATRHSSFWWRPWAARVRLKTPAPLRRLSWWTWKRLQTLFREAP